LPGPLRPREDKRILIAGVVGDVRDLGLDEPTPPTLYMVSSSSRMTLLVKTAGDPMQLAAPIRDAIHRADPEIAVVKAAPVAQYVADSLARRRFAMLLLGCFAFISLVLAAIGIYGVLAYLVSQGTREIGIRMALGAPRNAILSLVVSRGIVLAAGGVAIGVLGALLLTRLMRGLLFGVKPTDAVTFCVIPLLLLMISLAATSIPARRASQVDPAECLRYD